MSQPKARSRVASWSVADAKAHLSEVIARAETQGPQMITRQGKKVVVVVSLQTWERRQRRKGSLADFFATSPLAGSQLALMRSKARPRSNEL